MKKPTKTLAAVRLAIEAMDKLNDQLTTRYSTFSEYDIETVYAVWVSIVAKNHYFPPRRECCEKLDQRSRSCSVRRR